MATEATVTDFYALGLHPDTVAGVEGAVSRVAHVGGGAGLMVVTEDSRPLGVFDVRVQVVTSGAPGAATVRWTLDGGATWSATVTAPSGSPLVIGVTGCAVTFEGALVAGDVYSFTAARSLERHLAVANAKVRSYLRRRFGAVGLPSWDDSIIGAAVNIAALSALTQRGYDPRNAGDKAVADRSAESMQYLKDVGAAIAHPDGSFDITETAPVVFSDAPRED